MTDRPEYLVLALVDSRNLRRAVVSTLLRDWGQTQGLELVALSSAHSLAEQRIALRCHMIVLSLGSERLTKEENLQQLKILRVLAEKAALVVLSDLEQADEVSLALEAGANGYITTKLDVESALHALSRILNGGTSFPASCLH